MWSIRGKARRQTREVIQDGWAAACWHQEVLSGRLRTCCRERRERRVKREERGERREEGEERERRVHRMGGCRGGPVHHPAWSEAHQLKLHLRSALSWSAVF